MPDPVAHYAVGDYSQIEEWMACTDGVAYRVTGYNGDVGDTWYNDMGVGPGYLTAPFLQATDFSPMPYGAFDVWLVYHFVSTYGAALPLTPGTPIYFDAWQWGPDDTPDWVQDVPVEDCLIDEWLAAPDEWTTCRTNMHIFSTDGAPAAGVVEVRTLFGEQFRPEGWTEATIAVAAGQRLDNDVTVGCARHVRVWFTPTGGTPTLLPSQYSPDEFGSGWDGTASYHTNFAGRVAPTDPLEDPGTSE
ncbi:MAG: hypothetical protein M5R40_06030 [Anaerolineae bacterium]|nr:hypothetical protein [Anaerolineae bacterium]